MSDIKHTKLIKCGSDESVSKYGVTGIIRLTREKNCQKILDHCLHKITANT